MEADDDDDSVSLVARLLWVGHGSRPATSAVRFDPIRSPNAGALHKQNLGHGNVQEDDERRRPASASHHTSHITHHTAAKRSRERDSERASEGEPSTHNAGLLRHALVPRFFFHQSAAIGSISIDPSNTKQSVALQSIEIESTPSLDRWIEHAQHPPHLRSPN